MVQIQAIRAYVAQERRWFLLGLVYLVAWINPFNWMTDWWRNHYSVLAAQPFVLLIFPIVLWGRRKAFIANLAMWQQWERHTGKQPKKGSLTLLLFGSALYFFAHFSRLSVAAILGLVLMLVGVIVCVYGKHALKPLLAPLVYLLLVVPWLPESATGSIELLGLRLHSTIIKGALLRLGHQVIISPDLLLIDGASIPTPLALYGMQGSFAAIVFFWGYGLYRHYSAQRILGQIFVGLTVAFVVHQLRFLATCGLINSNPVAAARLGNANCWLFTIPSLALTFFAISIAAKLRRPAWLETLVYGLHRLSRAIQQPMDRLFFGSARAGSSVGKGILIIFAPLTWVANLGLLGLEKVGKLIGASNKGLETLLRHGEKKLQNRRKR